MKRRTVIGSPYWMAPEVIQETSCKIALFLHRFPNKQFNMKVNIFFQIDDGKADVWSLGITLMELCEGNPPHFNVHPMRAIFIISSRAAPTLKEPEKWSPELVDFLSCCLVKNCEQRSTASDLLKHPWLRKTVKEIGSQGKGMPVLRDLIMNNWDEIERIRCVRFNLNPPDESPEHDDHHDLSQSNSLNNSMHHPSSEHDSRMAGMNAAAQALAAHHAHHEDGYSIASSEKSQYDDSTLRAVSLSRQNSFSGIPATRQQMRNRSLSRSNSNSRSTTPISTPSNPNRAAARLNNVGGSNIGMHFAYESDGGTTSPSQEQAPGKTSSNTSQDMMMSDFKAVDAKGDNDAKRRKSRDDKESKLAALEAVSDSSRRYDSPDNDYRLDDMVRTSGNNNYGAQQQGSMVRAPVNRAGATMDDVIITPVAVNPSAAKSAAPKAGGGGGFMSALKYFQDEPLPASAAVTKPTARRLESDHKTPSQANLLRVPTPVMTSNSEADEMEMLHDLSADGEAHNLFIKKVSPSHFIGESIPYYV